MATASELKKMVNEIIGKNGINQLEVKKIEETLADVSSKATREEKKALAELNDLIVSGRLSADKKEKFRSASKKVVDILKKYEQEEADEDAVDSDDDAVESDDDAVESDEDGDEPEEAEKQLVR
jgi:hypothetical protein